ncbi:phage tail protein, partial [Rhodovulum adriaticum]|nr:phage tail protein [Rhodovulum adriaticum]
LGVSAGGGGTRPVQVVMNISTPDADSFTRSRSQIAAEMGRALSRGQRNR